eukprot:CAMPEP_0198199108 /NCGR_PEP_ID=MMETSP1445-20131203/2438_1 /TAXON_ID=36898 /ORGANISM="Pyramimonas sp., Strain CCMP2087" /LENGTH=324 /DNA_ID=CAMNT_0043868847 /DNA_START=327 /DNA_END=1301 /DNA_ORIENTATION=+
MAAWKTHKETCNKQVEFKRAAAEATKLVPKSPEELRAKLKNMKLAMDEQAPWNLIPDALKDMYEMTLKAPDHLRGEAGIDFTKEQLAGMHLQLGIWQFKKTQNLQAAMFHYEQATTIDPKHARAYFEMGVVLQLLFRKEPDVKKQLAMLQKNVELNEQAVKLKPGSWEDLLGPGRGKVALYTLKAAYGLLGSTHHTSGNRKDAIKIMRYAVKRWAGDPLLLHSLANSLLQEGLLDGPEGALVTYELADAAFQEGQASGDDQIRDIFVYPEGNSVPAGIANNLAGIYLQKGEWLKGLEHMRRAHALQPQEQRQRTIAMLEERLKE